MMKFLQKTHSQPPKRILVISLVSFGVLAVVYVAFSVSFWQAYGERAPKLSRELKASIEASLVSPENTPPTEAIDRVVADFDDSTSPCDTSLWFGWQTFIPAVGSAVETCRNQAAAATTALSTLRSLSAYLKAEKQAADLVATTTKNAKATSDFSKASTIWKEFSTSQQLPDAFEFSPVKDKLTVAAGAIADAYNALIAANKKEDADGWDKAMNSLKKGYGGIKMAQTTAKETRGTLINTFVSAYEKL